MRRFSRETDLRDPVAQWLTESVGVAAVADELDSGHGVADLVGAFDARLVDRVTAKIPALTSLLQVQVVERLQKPATSEELRSWAPHGWRGLHARALAPLLDSGTVKFDDVEDRWRLSCDVPPPFGQMIAVELKLKDVRRAVVQAARYRLFAEQSYVAVPASRATDHGVDLVTRSGVGLLAISPDGNVEKVVTAPRRRPIDSDTSRLAAERVFRAVSTPSPRRIAGSPRGRASVPVLVAG